MSRVKMGGGWSPSVRGLTNYNMLTGMLSPNSINLFSGATNKEMTFLHLKRNNDFG